jgi:hypothetical protein
VSRVNDALLRVLYELAEDLARGLVADAALSRARQDETVAPYLRGAGLSGGGAGPR